MRSTGRRAGARYRELSAFIEEEQNGARYSEAAQSKGLDPIIA